MGTLLLSLVKLTVDEIILCVTVYGYQLAAAILAVVLLEVQRLKRSEHAIAALTERCPTVFAPASGLRLLTHRLSTKVAWNSAPLPVVAEQYNTRFFRHPIGVGASPERSPVKPGREQTCEVRVQTDEHLTPLRVAPVNVLEL